MSDDERRRSRHRSTGFLPERHYGKDQLQQSSITLYSFHHHHHHHHHHLLIIMPPTSRGRGIIKMMAGV